MIITVSYFKRFNHHFEVFNSGIEHYSFCFCHEQSNTWWTMNFSSFSSEFEVFNSGIEHYSFCFWQEKLNTWWTMNFSWFRSKFKVFNSRITHYSFCFWQKIFILKWQWVRPALSLTLMYSIRELNTIVFAFDLIIFDKNKS